MKAAASWFKTRHEEKGPRPKLAVSIAARSGHGAAMDRALDYSFWVLGILISFGIVVAIMIW